MGMDISILTDNYEKIFSSEYHNPANNYFNKHSLSRTFCNLMCRQNVINGEPELDQIGRITGVDITPIYKMETYGSDNNEELEFFLEVAESEEEKQKLLSEAIQRKEDLKGNIESIEFTIDALINKLQSIDKLPTLLNDHGHDTLGYNKYFTDFNIDKGEGYIGNNFGQDLRNFQRFLAYAKSEGATTAYFNYG